MAPTPEEDFFNTISPTADMYFVNRKNGKTSRPLLISCHLGSHAATSACSPSQSSISRERDGSRKPAWRGPARVRDRCAGLCARLLPMQCPLHGRPAFGDK